MQTNKENMQKYKITYKVKKTQSKRNKIQTKTIKTAIKHKTRYINVIIL